MRFHYLLSVLFLFLYLSSSAQVQKSSREYLLKGIELFDSKNYAQAAEQFEKVSVYDTNAAIAEYELALCYTSDTTKLELGEQKIRKALLRPHNSLKRDLYVLLGNNLDLQKKYKQSEAMYDSIAAMYPNDYAPIYEKAASFYGRKMYKEAALLFQKSLLMNAFHYRSHYNLGLCYMKLGRLTEAFLAIQTALMVTNNKEQSSYAIRALSNYITLTDSILNFNKNKDESFQHDLYDEIDELLLSKISFSNKFKLKTELDDKLTRQLQVILEKLKYNESDNNFVMQYYVPFYIDMFGKDLFDALAVYCYSEIGIESVDKHAKKIGRSVETVKNSWYTYRSKLIGTRILNYTAREKADIKYAYFPSDNMFVEGKANLNTDNSKFEFKFDDYIKAYVNGILVSEGKYDNGIKTGIWKYYYNFGGLKSIEEMDNNKIVSAKFYNKEGAITSEKKYDINTGEEREFTNFRDNGTKEYTYNQIDKKNLKIIYYHKNDALEAEYNGYKNKIDDGTYTIYNDNGTVRRILNVKNSKFDGDLEIKNGKGKIIEKGFEKKGNKDGEYTSYFDNGTIKEKYVYDDGLKNGPYEVYNSKGNLTQKGNFKKAKLDGEILYYDQDNNLMATYLYESGVLKRTTFEHPDLKSQIPSGRTLRIPTAAGTISKSTSVNADGDEDGPFVEYYLDGSPSYKGRYKQGLKEGEWTAYYKNGKIKNVISYNAGVRNGAYKEYYESGELFKKGEIKEDMYVGEWIEYYKNGKEQEKYFFYNGKINGPRYYYFSNGKVSSIDWYSMGMITGVSFVDTNGNIFKSKDWVANDDNYKLLNFFGDTRFSGKRKNGVLDGEFIRYYTNNTIWEKGNYRLGDLDGKFVAYNYNGTIEKEGSFKDNHRVGFWVENDDLGNKLREYTYNDDGETTNSKFYLDGRVFWEQEYLNDERHGKKTYYSENNNIVVVLYYSDGYIVGYSGVGKDGKLLPMTSLKKGEGKIETQFPSGSPAVSLNFKNGEFDSKQIVYYENGKIADERDYKDYMLNGKIKKYSTNGNLIYEGNFVNDDNVGVETFLDKNGKIQAKLNYVNDELTGINEFFMPSSGKTVQLRFESGILMTK